MTVSDTKMKIFLEFGVEGYGGTRRLTALDSKSKELRRSAPKYADYGAWLQIKGITAIEFKFHGLRRLDSEKNKKSRAPSGAGCWQQTLDNMTEQMNTMSTIGMAWVLVDPAPDGARLPNT